ncbi:MAG TPA: hypothetical protein VLT17_11455 [Gemmatimonadales bacterium]|nr:hypothetical protein [Gemmatimonadales bacterium]
MVATVAAIIVLLAARSGGTRLEDAANDMAVRGAAGYLSLRARPDGRGRFLPAHLLSLSSSLASSSFWGAGLQVTYGTTPLLPDLIDLSPMLAQLPQTQSGDSVRHLELESPVSGRVSAAQLWNHRTGLREGWILVWGAAPVGSESNRRRLVGLVALAGVTALAGAFYGWRRVRVLASLVGALALVLLGGSTSLSIAREGRTATDVSLVRLRRLVEIAASSREIRLDDLSALLPDVTTRLVRPPFERRSDPPVARETRAGEPWAFLIASLRGGNGLEIGIRPLESGLGPYHWKIWLATVAGLLGFLLASGAGGAGRGDWTPGRIKPFFDVA